MVDEADIIARHALGWTYFYIAVPTASDIHYAFLGPTLGGSYSMSPDKRIACYKYGSDVPTPPAAFFVSTFKLVVTCQDCLELIHA